MSSLTHSGMFFHKGTKKLTLGKEEINTAIEFPDDFEFNGLKEEKRFLKSFIDDVTRFEEKVSKTTQKIYDEATARIVEWILEEDVEIQKTSVFTPNEAIGSLKTALVQCNFTDIHRLIHDFRVELFSDEISNENQEISDFLVTEEHSIHWIIDRIVENVESDICIILIRQFESLHPQLLDSVVSLIYSNRLIRPIISRLRLVVCVSTSPEFFKQTCSMKTINQMHLKMFEFTKLDEIFSKVISTGIHSYFAPPRPKFKSIEEDDPHLLHSFDISPGVFSGPFLKYLQNRFFSCDYSIDALIRAVQFSLLQKYLEDPLWREDSHEEELRKYDRVLRTFKQEFWENDEISLHIEIQSNPQFWQKMKEESSFRERKAFLFDGPRNGLNEFVQRILKDFSLIDEEWCLKLKELMEKLEEARIETSNSSTTTTPARPTASSKLSFSEHQKQQKMMREAKQNNPIRILRNSICAHVMSIFEQILQPYPSTWRNVIGAADWTSKHVKTSLDSSDEYDIEKCLLNERIHVEEPLSIAWRTLLTTGKFKTVSMADWAAQFLDHIKMPKKQARGAFFAAAGQLEHIGLIRGSADRKSTNVNVLYHPISFIPDI